MRALLSGAAAVAAAIIIPAAPAAAQQFVAGPGIASESGSAFDGPFPIAVSDDRDGRRDRRRNRGTDIIVYDRDWQGNSVWRRTSFNDWWHERPERSFPRWMQSNHNCERVWWGGGGWRC